MNVKSYFNPLRCAVVAQLFIVAGNVMGQATTYSYEGAVSAPFNSSIRFILDTTGTFTGYTDQSFTLARHGFEVTVDPNALTARFDEFRLTTSGITFNRTEALTVGFGQTKTFNLTLNFDPLLLRWGENNSVSHSLSAGSNGDYKVAGLEPGLSAFYASGNLTGSYTIAGPTQTVTGTFSRAVQLDPGNSGGFVGDRIGTSGYPGSLTVGSSTDSPTYYVANFVVAGGPNFISETVDGVSISTGVYRVYASGITDASSQRLSFSQGELAAIPEPSTYAVIAGALALIGVAVQRARGRSNS